MTPSRLKKKFKVGKVYCFDDSEQREVFKVISFTSNCNVCAKKRKILDEEFDNTPGIVYEHLSGDYLDGADPYKIGIFTANSNMAAVSKEDFHYQIKEDIKDIIGE